MAALEGMRLLDGVAERIIESYLKAEGHTEVRRLTESDIALKADGIDVTHFSDGKSVGIKVKSDPYVGNDADKAVDRSRSFYRGDTGAYAFETVANSATREPGWLVSSRAADLYYYYVAIDQTEAEVATLYEESDAALLSGLQVATDELHILPMTALRAWFEPRQERFPTRPVIRGGVASWCRLVPRADVIAGVPGARVVGPIFGSLSH